MATQNYFAPGWTSQSDAANTEQGSGAAFLGIGQPASQGYLAWSVEPQDATTVVANPTSTGNNLIKVYFPVGGFASKVDVNITTVGTQTHTYFGLYTLAGVQIAVTADLTASWTGTGKFTATFASPALVSPGFYYVLWNQTFSVAPQVTSGATCLVQNFNTTAATMFFGLGGGAGANSATPPATITLANNTASTAGVPWVAVY